MTQKVSKSSVRQVAPRVALEAAAKASPAAKRPRRPAGDEMSTGKGSALRATARKTVSSPGIGGDYLAAFDKKIAQLQREVALGRPGAAQELAAVKADREGVQKAVAEAERAVPRDEKKIADLHAFGVRVAGMNPKERQDLKNFFKMAKEDPEGLKRFIASVQQQQQTGGAAPVAQTAPTGAPANIQAAIDFGMSQLGAPYVGGASPFRFGTPGDGRTYQMDGQKAYVSPKGVIGYDCSGLMVTMLKKAGINISHLGSSRAMKASLPKVDKHNLQPGDLLVKNGHVAMYIGNGQMIESVPGGVKVSDASKYINDPAYSGHRPG